RLSRVDLSLLRLATFELLARPDIPPSVAIDEAIEIARRFGSEDSPAFVNGVLDHIAQVLGVKAKPERPEGGWRGRGGRGGTTRRRSRRSGSAAGRRRAPSRRAPSRASRRTTSSQCSRTPPGTSTWGTCATTRSAT